MLVSILASLVLSAHANVGSGLDLSVSLKGTHVELPKSQQMAEWLELKDEAYNSKGFYQWKPQKEGFLMKNKDSNELACKVNTNEHSESQLNVGFDCTLNEKKKETSVKQSAADATARFRSKLKTASKFTPLQVTKLIAQEPDAENDALNKRPGIDDGTPTAEGDFTNDHREQQELDQIDLGDGKLASEKDSFVGNPEMKNSPYVGAGVEREVNERMFEFFKEHPQYHSPEANWRAARLWKHEIEAGQPGKGAALGSGMWNDNKCSKVGKVPVGWPDVPDVQCQSYAISPMGYWGCKWLYEDGTCGYIQYYPTIRWDGLDAYVTKNHDEEDADLKANGAFPLVTG